MLNSPTQCGKKSRLRLRVGTLHQLKVATVRVWLAAESAHNNFQFSNPYSRRGK